MVECYFNYLLLSAHWGVQVYPPFHAIVNATKWINGNTIHQVLSMILIETWNLNWINLNAYEWNDNVRKKISKFDTKTYSNNG